MSDGESLWAVRYATDGPARSLFASTDVNTLRRLHPDESRLQRLSDRDRVIVSEPFADLPGAWQEIPQSSAVIARHGGELEHLPFQPRGAGAPSASHAFASSTSAFPNSFICPGIDQPAPRTRARTESRSVTTAILSQERG